MFSFFGSGSCYATTRTKEKRQRKRYGFRHALDLVMKQIFLGKKGEQAVAAVDDAQSRPASAKSGGKMFNIRTEIWQIIKTKNCFSSYVGRRQRRYFDSKLFPLKMLSEIFFFIYLEKKPAKAGKGKKTKVPSRPPSPVYIEVQVGRRKFGCSDR